MAVMTGTAPALEAAQKGYLGGIVENESIFRSKDDLTVFFNVGDSANTVEIEYRGVLPALFKEGRPVVVVGQYQHGKIVATKIMAKHDEYYRAKEVFHDR